MDKTLSEIQGDVLSTIRNDTTAAEIQLALFSAALLSYRKDSCLRPFPEFLQSHDVNEEKDVHKLEQLFELIPPLDELLVTTSSTIYSDEHWKLLHWILCKRTLTITTCEKTKLKELQEKTGHSSFSLQPDYIFKVNYSTNSSQKFDEQASEYGLKYGYHGSRMDNFYSIVANGLQVHMMKNGLFGDGIYLCEDLAVTMPYVSGGHIWKHSKIGQQLSCVAVCEILDHPDVKYQEAKKEKPSTSSSNRATAANSQCGEVPDKYFVVTKSDLLRIRYLLIFLDKKPAVRCRPRGSWICSRHPVATILFIYLLFLILMGVWKTRTVQLYIKRNWKSQHYDDEG